MKTTFWRVGAAILGMTTGVWSQPPVILENPRFRLTLTDGGTNAGFTDRATGVDYLRRGKPSPFAWVARGTATFPVSRVELAGDRLALGFTDADVRVSLKVEARERFLRLTVASFDGASVDTLTFLNVPLTVRGEPSEPFGACALSLNPITRVDALPALQSELRASATAKFGIVGAKVAIVAAPPSEILRDLKEVLLEANEMPLCKVAGPWANEIPFNHGSYLFNFGSLTEATVDNWITMAKDLGFTQIDNHGGSAEFFRFGDFTLNPKKWPEGWETFRRIVARLHDAGIGSIFHTYGFFIDKHSKYVSPLPSPHLDAFRTFTLAESVGPDATEIEVNESTAGMSTVTGFFEHNSVVLHLGDELATFSGVSAVPPWRFTGVERGALGTRTAAHEKGSAARQLKECFGLFVPNPESPLFEEDRGQPRRNRQPLRFRRDLPGCHRRQFDPARAPDECWYWADKFVFDIQKRLQRPVGMEMSAMWHHFWQYRTRWQAWDYPQRGHRRFVDLHAQAVNGGLLLPPHLGWWNFQTFDPPQVEPTYPETIAQLGARLVGWGRWHFAHGWGGPRTAPEAAAVSPRRGNLARLRGVAPFEHLGSSGSSGLAGAGSGVPPGDQRRGPGRLPALRVAGPYRGAGRALDTGLDLHQSLFRPTVEAPHRGTHVRRGLRQHKCHGVGGLLRHRDRARSGRRGIGG